MINTESNCLSGNNSTALTTSAHETRIPTSLQQLNEYVTGVHKAIIRIYPNRVTAVINIHGRQITGGGSTMAELIEYINSQQENHREWIKSERRRKSRRNPIAI